MRKLLVLMLVLVMASLASAGTVTISGDTTINVGATKTYTVTYSGTPDLCGFDIDVHNNNKGTIGAPPTYLAANRNTVYDGYWQPPRDEEGAGIEVTEATDGATLGTTWFTITVTATGVKDDVITLTSQDIYIVDTDWNQASGHTMGTLGITIVPEPMTLVLLGLGGLFLRRRR